MTYCTHSVLNEELRAKFPPWYPDFGGQELEALNLAA